MSEYAVRSGVYRAEMDRISVLHYVDRHAGPPDEDGWRTLRQDTIPLDMVVPVEAFMGVRGCGEAVLMEGDVDHEPIPEVNGTVWGYRFPADILDH